MTRFLILFFLFFFQLQIMAQNTPLMVQLDDQQKPYLNHVVGVKENFYSIGRIYNISPRVFAPYNGLDLTSGLSIGQTIRIPLNEANFWQTGARKANETVVPVYHQVQSKETVTIISRNYSADKAALISWNNISGEKISVGDKIIIGFLKVDKTLSPLAAQGMGPRREPPVPSVEEKPKENKAPEKQIPVKVEEKPIVEKPVQPIKKPVDEMIAAYSGSGYFKEEFDEQTNKGKNIQTNTYNGGSFKSTSGWTDGKYYVLIDGIEKGTIVRIVNLSNKKMVYAKVLASISETKPGATENFLISNATASQLDAKGNNYDLEISWEK